MSYDVWLEVDVGEIDLKRLDLLDANYTSNVCKMFVVIIGDSIRTWDGKKRSIVRWSQKTDMAVWKVLKSSSWKSEMHVWKRLAR